MECNISRRNHYIPRFYLKNWSLDGKTIYTYNILVPNAKVPYWTQQSIKNSAIWNDFYTRLAGKKEMDDFEHWFDREFEAPSKPIFDKLLSGQKISREESVILSHFVFAQYVRTPAAYIRITKQNMQLFPKVIDETALKINKNVQKIKNDFSPQSKNSTEDNLFPMKANLNKQNSTIKIEAIIGRGSYLHNLRHFLTSTLKKVEHHDWQVIHASEDVSFPTSDDPVICMNYRNEHDYDFNGGWRRKKCNIIMPLSPHSILFTQVGERGPYNDLNYSPKYSRLFRRMIIQHAHRYVYAERPQRGMLELNARIVNRDLYEREKQHMDEWHIEQIRAEHELWSEVGIQK